jgi:excisionase family DNA binding protein
MIIQDTEYLSTIEVAAHYNVAYQTVYKWINNGLLSGVIDRGPNRRLRYLIPATALDGFEPPSKGGKGWPAGRKRG